MRGMEHDGNYTGFLFQGLALSYSAFKYAINVCDLDHTVSCGGHALVFNSELSVVNWFFLIGFFWRVVFACLFSLLVCHTSPFLGASLL